MLLSECADRHISCRHWQIDGYCHGKSELFMQENCRASCRLCRTLKDADCFRPSAVSHGPFLHMQFNRISETFHIRYLQLFTLRTTSLICIYTVHIKSCIQFTWLLKFQRENVFCKVSKDELQEMLFKQLSVVEFLAHEGIRPMKLGLLHFYSQDVDSQGQAYFWAAK